MGKGDVNAPSILLKPELPYVRESMSIRFTVEAGLPKRHVLKRAEVARERGLRGLEKRGWKLDGALRLIGPYWHTEPTEQKEFKVYATNEALDDWCLVGWFTHKAFLAEIPIYAS